MNKKCQVFTPENICIKMLDMANYTGDLYGKKVLENSCGDGHILTKIVKRYIDDCINRNIKKHIIKKGLENDIYAYEIDKKHIENCIIQLDNIAKEYGIIDVNWKINKNDYLVSDNDILYDFIIGNPPYITYRDLDIQSRNILKNSFESCKKGKFDYCYAFIEKSMNNLNENGKLVYIIPSSIFKNRFARNLREKMIDNLTEIVDFKGIKVFPNALTSSAIIKVVGNSKGEITNYIDYNKNTQLLIQKKELGLQWNFGYKNQKKQYKFGDFFDCSITIATLLNDVFIISNYKSDKKYTYFDNSIIENKLLRRAVSPKNLNYNKKEKIIFPYKYSSGVLKKYKLEEFQKKFPYAFQYLFANKKKLENRCSDKTVMWYEYGRSQALSHINQEKILCSTIITDKIKTYLLNKNDIPYSGIYIIKKSGETLKTALNILNSKEFLDYVYKVGINASGNSIRITPQDIEEFPFSDKEMKTWKN